METSAAAVSAPQAGAPRDVPARRDRSKAQSASGTSTAIQPSRCPPLWTRRYGAIANARPPSAAAATGRSSSPQPEVGEEAGGEGHGEHEQVPRDDRAEERLERPEREAVGPAAEHDLRLHERLVAVRIAPRLRAGSELVADEPEAIARLEVVAGGGLAVARQAVGDELRAEVEQTAGSADDDRRDGEERHEAQRARTPG